ncbi:GAF domain-containing protein [Dactylosporangium sp. CA-233914]|uniref:GAF domain-containing protein n=1 Tax=Dactylosporangium sp. CA-233914 TaxID=3239934 RepID=UPI003D929C43
MLDGILMAAGLLADACVLRRYDPDAATLRITRHRGLTPQYVTSFATVETGPATACGIAATTGRTVVVDDVTRSPILAGKPVRDALLAAGSRAVQAYPLHDGRGRLLGVLSFHDRTTAPRGRNRELIAWCAARALAGLPG